MQLIQQMVFPYYRASAKRTEAVHWQQRLDEMLTVGMPTAVNYYSRTYRRCMKNHSVENQDKQTRQPDENS